MVKSSAAVCARPHLFLLQETEIWVAYKQDKEAAAAYISACAGVVLLLATLLQPFMPSFTAKLLAQLGASEVGGGCLGPGAQGRRTLAVCSVPV